jgi:hypothetical protein
MKTLLLLTLAGLSLAANAVDPAIRTGLTQSPDQRAQPNVPKGKLEGPFDWHSKIIPNTVRRYWIYVPAQYHAAKPASVLVFQDGQRAIGPKGGLQVPQVLENLMARGAIPVTIGIFVTPGNLSETYPDNLGLGNPNHRAPEYDALDGRYARLLSDELLPAIAQKYSLTNDPEQRAIGGTSSGAIAAFTVAWQRPDLFRKVFSAVGSYVSIGFRPDESPIKLGGQDYPPLIRREPIKPIRIFMQDGSNDLSNEWGNWFLANQEMVSAFEYANRNADEKGIKGPRYEVMNVWTDGAHKDDHAGALLSEALSWLLKHSPKAP